MPLHLQFLRDDVPRAMPHGFGSWHLGVALDAAAVEHARATHQRLPDFALADIRGEKASNDEFHRISKMGWAGLASGDCTITKQISFEDPEDGEVLELIPGDKIRCYR